MTIFANFDRAMLRTTFAEVLAVVPQAKARDVGACQTWKNMWTAEINRPCYGGHFHWSGNAENAWHAKQQLWESWLVRFAPFECTACSRRFTILEDAQRHAHYSH